MNFQAKSIGTVKVDDSRRVVLDHVRLHGVDFSGRRLTQFSSAGSSLVACRFEKAVVDDASFGGGLEMSEYVDCRFDGARIRFGPGGFARFVRCSFREVDLRDWFCFAVELVECTFSGRLRKAYFNGTVPEDKGQYVGRDRNEFRGNDFSGMELIDVAFRTGIDLTEQRLPSGPEYVYLQNAVAAIRRARASVISWQDLDRRQAAMALIRSLEYELAAGQRQLLLRPKEYSTYPKETVDSVVNLLRNEGMTSIS